MLTRPPGSHGWIGVPFRCGSRTRIEDRAVGDRVSAAPCGVRRDPPRLAPRDAGRHLSTCHTPQRTRLFRMSESSGHRWPRKPSDLSRPPPALGRATRRPPPAFDPKLRRGLDRPALDLLSAGPCGRGASMLSLAQSARACQGNVLVREVRSTVSGSAGRAVRRIPAAPPKQLAIRCTGARDAEC